MQQVFSDITTDFKTLFKELKQARRNAKEQGMLGVSWKNRKSTK